ncbi:hypothetical protein [Microbacterium sp. TNHR37B]|uniref:hypothetical protein n=1 Tax=Microbacterium sp. TNHR37B TaxID=1775956 RepID=UPI0007B3096B|nr:hypothetical protein [Microbacterium sp. TNHR37B]KZE88904.1 hypothetical protein AVP41_01694 [Microbacterium sp. TNHR37B]
MHERGRATRHERALRGAAAAVIATVLAATAHTLAGGGAPAWWMVVGVALLVLPCSVWLAGRRMGAVGTMASVLLTQGLLHVAFVILNGTEPVRMAGGHHHASTALPALSMPDGATALHAHLTPGMIVAHAIAGLLTIVLLLAGEAAVRRIARGIRSAAARVLSPIVSAPHPRGVVPAHTAIGPSPVFLSVLSRRGPPTAAF